MTRVLLVAPSIERDTPGEAFVAYKWAEALSDLCELTVLAFQSPGRPPLAERLPGAEVITFQPPAWPRRVPRLNAMLKPGYPVFARHVRRWLAEARAGGRQFDIAHQIMPQAARYASPLRGAGIPYVIGPLGGGLATPPGFRHEMGADPWFTRLRRLDGWRYRHDPWLRASYAGAAVILGVAPYVAESLRDIPLRRFEVMLELGIDDLPPARPPRQGGGLRLLHVGRGTRTKGLRDAVRAMAHLRDLPDVTLTSAGTGPEIDICRAEAERLGVADRITFEGFVPRARVEELYRDADVFVFPSFREPAGNVLYEAMRHGLPVVCVARGGPDAIVDDRSGIRLPVTTPEAMARDVAGAVRRLHADPDLRGRMGEAGRARLGAEGLWPLKARRLVALYGEVLAEARTGEAAPGGGPDGRRAVTRRG